MLLRSITLISTQVFSSLLQPSSWMKISFQPFLPKNSLLKNICSACLVKKSHLARLMLTVLCINLLYASLEEIKNAITYERTRLEDLNGPFLL